MPRRSHETSKPLERQSVVSDVKPIKPVNTSCYGTFVEFCHRAKTLKSLSEWNTKLLANRFVFKKVVEPYLLLGNCRGRQSWLYCESVWVIFDRRSSVVPEISSLSTESTFVDFDKELGGLHNVLWHYYY